MQSSDPEPVSTRLCEHARETTMSEHDRIDRFLVMHSARADQWREALTAAEQWAAGRGTAAKVADELRDVAVTEEFHAYPGVRLVGRLQERLSAGDAAAVAGMVRRIADTILTNSFAQQADGMEAGMDADDLPDVLPSVVTGHEQRRPYFEVLLVTPQPRNRWPAMAAEFRRLRRPEDQFVYEPVIVGSFEDALCAVLVNPLILSVIVAEGFALRSAHDAPVLRSLIDKALGKLEPSTSALALAGTIKKIRPELDLYRPACGASSMPSRRRWSFTWRFSKASPRGSRHPSSTI